MDNRAWFEGSDKVEDEAFQQGTPEDTDSELMWDYWHSGFWRVDMNGACEQDIEIEPVRIYEAPFSQFPFHIRFSEQLSDEEFKKHLRTLEAFVDEGGLDAIRG